MKMEKHHFTYIMKLLDLNITYDDGKGYLYDFRAKHNFTEENPIKEDFTKMNVKLNIPEVSLNLFFNGEFLTNVIATKLDILIDRSMKGIN